MEDKDKKIVPVLWKSKKRRQFSVSQGIEIRKEWTFIAEKICREDGINVVSMRYYNGGYMQFQICSNPYDTKPNAHH